MKRRTRIIMCVALLVAVGGTAPLSAFADSCPAQIVVGKRGNFDEYAYFNSARIASANIPTAPGAKYECTFGSHYGSIVQAHGLDANEWISSIGNGWLRYGDEYTCQEGEDCTFVIQKN